MKKTMMYLPEELHRFLAREASERDVSMAQIAREAISDYKTRCGESRHEGVKAIIDVLDDEAAETDLALRVDGVLAEEYGDWAKEKGLDAPDRL